MSNPLRHVVVLLLIVLLPLQAAAAGRLALCAERIPAQASPHCQQLAAQSTQPEHRSPLKQSHSQSQTGCWLGSTCLIGLAALALPSNGLFISHADVQPWALARVSHYLSFIADSPQRPPTSLS